jgi:peptidoglycan/LPS O-acetylase OafA/YrhL
MILSLEGLRGIAALLVALYHLEIGRDYFSVIRNGYLFVDLFFVLSGFVISATYSSRLTKISDFRPFLIRRIGRLLPLLIFSTITFLLIANLIVLAKKLALAHGYGAFLHNPGALQYLVPSVKEILSTLTFTQSLGLFDHLILNTPTWSISTEFYTYFLFAALCLFVPRRAAIVAFALLCVGGLLASTWASATLHNCGVEGGCLGLTYDFGIVRCLYSFFLGTLVYHSSRRFRINPLTLQVIGLFGLFLVFNTIDYVPLAAFAFPPAFALLVLSICKDSGPLAAMLQIRPFQALGQRSYSIYLMHMPLLLIFQNVANRAHGLLATSAVVVVYVAVLVTIAGWTYRFIENPMRAVFNRHAARRSTVPAAAPLAEGSQTAR